MKYFILFMLCCSNAIADNTQFFKELRLTVDCHKAISDNSYHGGVLRCDEVAEIMKTEEDVTQVLRIIVKRYNLVYVAPSQKTEYRLAPQTPSAVYNRYRNSEGVIITTGPGTIMFDNTNVKR